MSRRLARARALLAICAAVAAFPEEEDVVVLTADNFDSFIKQSPLALVEFYAPWCGHCKQLAPAWSKAAAKSKKLPVPVPLAKVDATVEEDLASKYEVSGYPTIKLFKNGVAEDYIGPRDADGILAYVAKISGFKLQQLNSTEDLTALAKKSTHPIVLGLFRMPVAASSFFQKFSKAAFEATGQPVVFAYSASYATPPLMPPTVDGKKPPVPGLVLLDPAAISSPVSTRGLYTMPSKKEDFTLDASESRHRNRDGSPRSRRRTISNEPTAAERRRAHPTLAPAVAAWLNSNGVKVALEEKEELDDHPKDYSEHGDDHDSSHYEDYD